MVNTEKNLWDDRADELKEQAQEPFGALQQPAADASAWAAELTRRLRVLLHTAPLDALRQGDPLRGEESRHHDSLLLALRVLDLVIDRTGHEVEADTELAAQELEPLLKAMDEAAGVEVNAASHAAAIARVLGGLRNDAEARRPFKGLYTAVNGHGQATRHALEFRLLVEMHHPDGRTVLRPSDEASNLYLRLLDLDIEDGQAAAEAIVESQLARGRFDEAVHSARQARLQSVRLHEKMTNLLRATRRDVDSVDWRHEMPDLLENAGDHLQRRMQVERSILTQADERLDLLDDEDDAGRQAVAEIAQLIRDCRLRHVQLHTDIISARRVFLDAQAQQVFVPAPSQPLPDLLHDVLEPLLALPQRDAAQVSGFSLPLLLGGRAPGALSLPDLITWLLQPKRVHAARDLAIEPIDPVELEADLLRYSPEIREQAASLLHGGTDPLRLSELLAATRARQDHPAVSEVLVLLALQAFSHEDHARLGLRAEFSGASLTDASFHGDDLLLTRSGSANGHEVELAERSESDVH